MSKRKWEMVGIADGAATYRLSVPGGWLYRVTLYEFDEDGEPGNKTKVHSVTVTFVPS